MGLGFWEITILLVIVAVIFGAGKLPSVMGDLAKGIKTFKSELSGDKAETPAPAPEAASGAPVTPSTAASTGPSTSPATQPVPTIEATATRVAVTDPVPPPVRSV
jgi:sec-independent protein translocase protein TatA